MSQKFNVSMVNKLWQTITKHIFEWKQRFYAYINLEWKCRVWNTMVVWQQKTLWKSGWFQRRFTMTTKNAVEVWGGCCLLISDDNKKRTRRCIEWVCPIPQRQVNPQTMKECLLLQNTQIVKSIIQELPVTKRIKMILIQKYTSNSITSESINLLII